MKNIWNFISRHAIWFIIGIISILFFNPGFAEIKTMLFITLIESLAIALSGIAVYAYTKIDFTKDMVNTNLGFIFLGVHLCIGLVVMGVYIAQFAN